MPTPVLTEDEIVSTLKNSKLPTVLVEGKDDAIIYRCIEEHIGTLKANILPCGGRNTLLSVHKRKREFSHLPIAFVADTDSWMFTHIPIEYRDIIWTFGYSIENDLYAGSDIENLIKKTDKNTYNTLLSNISKWFAFEIEEHRLGKEAKIDCHINQILEPDKINLNNNFLSERKFYEPNTELINYIQSNYQFTLRGKTLFQCLIRIISQDGSKYNNQSLFQICSSFPQEHKYLKRLISNIISTLTTT